MPPANPPHLRDADLDRLFRALTDATRRDIIARVLTGEPASISALADRYDMAFAAVQKHVAVPGTVIVILRCVGVTEPPPRPR